MPMLLSRLKRKDRESRLIFKKIQSCFGKVRLGEGAELAFPQGCYKPLIGTKRPDFEHVGTFSQTTFCRLHGLIFRVVAVAMDTWRSGQSVAR